MIKYTTKYFSLIDPNNIEIARFDEDVPRPLIKAFAQTISPDAQFNNRASAEHKFIIRSEKTQIIVLSVVETKKAIAIIKDISRLEDLEKNLRTMGISV